MVGDAAETAATADRAPLIDAQDDVHSVASEPGSLVEAVAGTTWECDHRERLQDGALRRSPAERKLELDALGDRRTFETPQLSLGADAKGPARRRRRHDDDRSTGTPNLGEHRAAVEHVESRARPPPTEHAEERGRESEASSGRIHDDDGARSDHRSRHPDRVQPRQVPEREPDAERAGE
jgi:hypothetical protein